MWVIEKQINPCKFEFSYYLKPKHTLSLEKSNVFSVLYIKRLSGNRVYKFENIILSIVYHRKKVVFLSFLPSFISFIRSQHCLSYSLYDSTSSTYTFPCMVCASFYIIFNNIYIGLSRSVFLYNFLLN